MEPQPAHRRTTLRSIRARSLVVAAMLVAGLWSTAASASSNSLSDCDRIARSLTSLTIDNEALSLQIVEHMAILSEPDFGEPADTPLLESSAVAPILLLTPRVAIMLREVFDSDVRQSERPVAVGTRESDESLLTDDTATMPPLASGDAPPDDVPALPPIVREDAANRYMPRFQRQMYRTDI